MFCGLTGPFESHKIQKQTWEKTGELRGEGASYGKIDAVKVKAISTPDGMVTAGTLFLVVAPVGPKVGCGESRQRGTARYRVGRLAGGFVTRGAGAGL